MKIFLTIVFTSCILAIGFTSGCTESESQKSTTTITTPKGETTVTTEKEVKKSGENPPPVPK